jgi:Asp-tRNA(Asn)/Glu-tRNA(Gln) amidotransferase A subunit family amidase
VNPPDRERILAEARQSEARWRNNSAVGKLDGVPITVKDTILTKRLPTLAGSTLVDPGQQWDEDAPAVARLCEERAIILGKTTTPEFGWKGVTDSPLTGITRNPWNPERTPGGSSGGSASAVAAGIGHAAVGTDAACLFLRRYRIQSIAGTHSDLSPKSAWDSGSRWSDLSDRFGYELTGRGHVAS